MKLFRTQLCMYGDTCPEIYLVCFRKVPHNNLLFAMKSLIINVHIFASKLSSSLSPSISDEACSHMIASRISSLLGIKRVEFQYQRSNRV